MLRADRWPYSLLAVGVAVLGAALWLGIAGGATSPAPTGGGGSAVVTDAGPPAIVTPPPPATAGAAFPRVRWHHAVALGQPWHGQLRDGVLLPAYGEDYVTWDPPLLR